jgi:type IV pilus assembly protein PilX
MTKNSNKTQRHQEEGSVLIVALIMLVLLTIIGISASRNTSIEMMIAGNERVAKENFYLAEAAAARGVVLLETSDLRNDPPSWLIGQDFLPVGGGTTLPLPASSYEKIDQHIHEDDNWTAVYSYNLSSDGLDGDIKFLAYEKPTPPGQSLKATQASKAHDYVVYGRSEFKNGQGLVAMGYRKAF